MAALVDSWTSWPALVKPRASSESMDTRSQRNGDSGALEYPPAQTIVPGTPPPLLQPSHPTSGVPTLPPPRQLASAIASLFPAPQNHNFSLPSNIPLSLHPHLSSMLTIRRSNKLRKPHSRISPTPPVLAPLSFVQDQNTDLDFEHISHDVPPSSPYQSQHFLTTEFPHPQDVPSPYLCQQTCPRTPRRLTKRTNSAHPSLPLDHHVPSSSAAAAAAAMTGNPAAPMSSSSNPHRARSDLGHGLRYSVSIKRANIIRRLSMRTPKPSFDSQAATSGLSSSTTTNGPPTPTSPLSRSSTGILSKWRGAISELGHDTINHDLPVSLPLVRITSPFSINAPPIPEGDAKVSNTDIPDYSCESVGMSSPILDESPFPCHRAKFTLEEENGSEVEPSTNPPSPKIGSATLHLESYSAPPSRVQSAYNPQYLSPASRSRPEPNSIKPPRRRWTFAMAMTDEGITDEVLVEELERMRLRKEWSGSIDDMDEVWDPDYVLFGTSGTTQEPELMIESPREEEFHNHHLHHHHHHRIGNSSSSSSSGYYNIQPQSQPSSSYTTPSSNPPQRQYRHNSVPLPDSGSAGLTQQWQTARRVLLTCRELVRTERHYLASLQMLLNSETEGTPPPLMLRYVEPLVTVNQKYLTQMEGNPSSWGVAAAFLASEEEIESAFVGWCGVVGMWFNDNDEAGRVDFRASQRKQEEDQEKSTTMNRIRRISVSTWRRSFTSITELSASVTPGGTKKREKGTAPPPSFSLYGHVRQRRSSNCDTSRAKKPPTIRDLAILPTQRIMRYVLLYRDLLEHTSPTSPSRGLIKRAADSAFRIAQNCDMAQTNSAFIVDSNKNDTPCTTTLCS